MSNPDHKSKKIRETPESSEQVACDRSAKTYTEHSDETPLASEPAVFYEVSQPSLFEEKIYTKPIELESRRYIGNKAKLTDWIISTIASHAKNAHSFCDIFAGTGAVANRALDIFDRVIINDFLYSNNTIYHAFFGPGDWDCDKLQDIVSYYNRINPQALDDNYFSINFGGKFYEYGLSKLIGFICQDIEEMRPTLTDKEYHILIASLIYSIDRLANTVGHFDAYIKKPIREQPLNMRLIDARSYDHVEIHRCDSNQLARNIEADIVYMDPPYNSRQYCRFYHLYETLVKWDNPQLYGVALKPKPENMSRYCTSRAVDAFTDLVSNINARYLAVSYNNTYQSKSKSSENKIKLKEIKQILDMCGETKVYEHTHAAFNAGKTEFENHKEILFITEVDAERKSKSFPTLLCGG